jgi:hypothetical protein
MAPRQRWIWGLALLLGAGGLLGGGGLLAATRLLPPVDAGRPAAIPELTHCAAPAEVAPAGAAPGSHASLGTFFKLQGTLDSHGALAGQHLVVGAAAQARAAADLPAESSASGPVGGVITLTADDGHASSLQLVNVAGGCATTVYTTDLVIRRAIVDPADGTLLFHVVSRTARADLGVWRLGHGQALPHRIVDPLPVSFGLGPVWATDLRLDSSNRLLAVQSCIDRGCLTRIVDLGKPGLPAIVVRGPRQGPLLGFAGDRIVTWAACDGFPCAVLAWDVASSMPTEIVGAASAAALTGDGRLLVALGADGTADEAFVVNLATGATRPLHGLAKGDRPIAAGGLAAMGLEVAPDQVALAPRAGDPHPIRPSAAGEVLP